MLSYDEVIPTIPKLCRCVQLANVQKMDKWGHILSSGERKLTAVRALLSLRKAVRLMIRLHVLMAPAFN